MALAGRAGQFYFAKEAAAAAVSAGVRAVDIHDMTSLLRSPLWKSCSCFTRMIFLQTQMIGVPTVLGAPSAPWHVLQTSNLAPRKACASAAFPGEATAAISGICSGAALSAARAGAARTTRTAKTVGKSRLIVSRCPLFKCPRSRDATNAVSHLKTCRSQARSARWRS